MHATSFAYITIGLFPKIWGRVPVLKYWLWWLYVTDKLKIDVKVKLFVWAP